MKKILGLDLGTNSIGWALINQDFENKNGNILGMGSRIIPMDQGILGEFEKGNSVSQTADRRRYRSVRRLRERQLLRRERLHRVLNVLQFLPEHYSHQIDFEKRLGKFIDDTEPKLAWKKNENGSYEFILQSSFLEMAKDFNGQKIPYDWTLYYLRKKALEKAITKEELAWLILNFNQKRGYYQLRGEDDETTDKREYVETLKVVSIEKGEVDKKNPSKSWYTCTLSNGWTYSATFTSEPLWLNTEKEFLIIEEIDEFGNVKITKDKKNDNTGREKRKITPLPSFDEIDLMSKADQDKIYKKIKAKTELTISNSGKTVGAYIYDSLINKPNQKINGKLIRTIERKFYRDELEQILRKQIELQPELFSEELYNDCVRELYRNNEAHQINLSKRDFIHLFVNDIIFYQRPLRSQKSSIGNCPLEFRLYKGKQDEKSEASNKTTDLKVHLKVIHKSNPYYQEFRLWQWIKNLSIHRKDEDLNVTSNFLSSIEDYEMLFEFLNNRKDIKQVQLIKFLLEQKGLKGKALNEEAEKYRWNYVEDKIYPCNETKAFISSRLEKVENVPDGFLSHDKLYQLWHIIYSVTDKREFECALGKYAIKHGLDFNSFVENFKKFLPFKSEYGAYSEKAIKKLLPLMRLGKYWTYDNIDNKTKERIEKLLTGEFDDNIKIKVREKAIHLTKYQDFQGLPEWLTKYIVYDRHSEADDIQKWNSVEDIEKYLEEFKQHSLRNPIVEQVLTETLRIVKDIWRHFGKGSENFFDEIHIELGREMKNPAEERKYLTRKILENENTNIRIKLLLAELKNDIAIEGVREHSPTQQEILRIYEEGVLDTITEIPDDIEKISKTAQPTKSELQRYKLWLEQKYCSPYTGQPIPLSRLFTPAYEIEHIIPQSRYFDDSLNNKVICEAAVNKLKDNRLVLEFVKEFQGQIVETGLGANVKIFTEEAYKDYAKNRYSKNLSKRRNLLLEEIPDKMIERQLNDTRYISKYVSSLLSRIVRADKDDDGVNSKNIIPFNGKITSTLKQDWGLNDVWNELILPRFERMNVITNSTIFITKNTQGKIIPTIPLELSKGFQKKRIDHRHHAMDALVIACATRDHVNLLNNESAKSDTKRYDLQHKLRRIEKWKDDKGNIRDKFSSFKKPWESFTTDAKNKLEQIIISFKQNLRVINKATNRYEKIENGKKIKVEQKGLNWAIRKPMHKETVIGKVSIRKIKEVRLGIAIDDFPSIVDRRLKSKIGELVKLKYDKSALLQYFKDRDYLFDNKDVSKVKIYYFDNEQAASRTAINTTFSKSKIVESITDTGIQKILLAHLSNYEGRVDEKGKEIAPETLAFTPEGIEEMNKNIVSLNDGKYHQPIFKVRTYEPMGNKFAIGTKGNKSKKYVEAAKGTNLFFAIYQDGNGKRSYETIPLNIVIERQKQGLSAVPEMNEKGDPLLFHLSPNDLVYVPTNEDLTNNKTLSLINSSNNIIYNIYKTVSSSGTQCFFVRQDVASPILDKGEFSVLNKMEKSIEGMMIKQLCIKIKVDRVGNITSIYPDNTNSL